MTKAEQNAVKIVKILNKAGYTALFAGGFVRDKILKRKTNDIDIATDAKPLEIKKVLTKNKIKFIEIGEAFGVIAAVIPVSKNKNQIFEIATFRQDFGVDDNRHPKKIKLISDPKEDAVRRDFTINGLFSDNGKVIDYVNGINDIKSKIIRFIGDPDERIKEDALRMLRAIRFASQLDFDIEKESYNAIIKNKNLIKKVSDERIREELTKILISNNKRRGFEQLEETGLLDLIIPELSKAKLTPQPKNYHFEGNVWNHTLLALEKTRVNDPIVCWAVLLHDVGKAFTIQMPEDDKKDRIRFNGHDSEGAKIAEKILRRLKFGNDEINKIGWMIKFHMLFSNLFKMREARRIMYLADPRFPALLELFWVDANSSVRSTASGRVLPPELSAYNRAKKILEAENNKPRLPKPILRGDAVMKLMGIKSGNKQVGDILAQIYDLQLEKKIKTKSEALKMAEKLLKRANA
jgi:poly(A) polymerase